LKTDKSIIADLPDKTEVKAFCHLSRKQAALYQAAVDELEQRLKETGDGIVRRGLVLAFLMRLKQICNHPTQWAGDGAYDEDDSGKFARLREIAGTIASHQEKLLVFTQFKEIIAPLERLLGAAFGRPGLVLHGETPVAKRKELVKKFQEDERTPFFVLSIKAGGAGLNLTSASHVVHFNRWWNPAVENQATDRAFRHGVEQARRANRHLPPSKTKRPNRHRHGALQSPSPHPKLLLQTQGVQADRPARRQNRSKLHSHDPPRRRPHQFAMNLNKP
ncbi:MAG: DEAD/DEAH box helicase, partial [Rhodoblastus sp.]|uniref:DEAD/DEAH box helicase n=1 Tax=Rhodoblastus sp. TaxID=1962975 RepID=UPI003F9BAB56